MATKAETFPDYLQRVASDMRESAIGHDSPTADDLDMAACQLHDVAHALDALVKAYNGPITPAFRTARAILRNRRPLGKKLS